LGVIRCCAGVDAEAFTDSGIATAADAPASAARTATFVRVVK
jgi:hypothetical protein